jgi:hypothetical protein
MIAPITRTGITLPTQLDGPRHDLGAPSRCGGSTSKRTGAIVALLGVLR